HHFFLVVLPPFAAEGSVAPAFLSEAFVSVFGAGGGFVSVVGGGGVGVATAGTEAYCLINSVSCVRSALRCSINSACSSAAKPCLANCRSMFEILALTISIATDAAARGSLL